MNWTMPNPLPDDDLLALWQVAWRMARRRCAAALARLGRGEGGFYGPDDLQQDLFLEFWALVQQWRASGQGRDALWAAWRRRLWGGGRRVLRRAPQRLWSRPEITLDPLALDPAGGSEPEDGLRIGADLLVQPEDAEATRHGLAGLEALERALWALRPVHRQVLYMAAFLEAPPAEVARLLMLEDAAAVHRRLHLARRALRRQLTLTEER